MRRRGLMAVLGAWFGTTALPARSQDAAPAAPAAARSARPPGGMKELGNERYQIDRIVVDRRARSFSMPGRIHALDKPLEYLATSRGGRKAYESLLEIDVSGSEMNLACILIGLERDPDLPGPRPPVIAKVVGQRVLLSLSWMDGGRRRVLSAAEALFNAESRDKVESVEWAYTGSFTSVDGSQFAADHTGTLISFVTDPTGLIGMVSGVGIGPYGSVRGSAQLPPEGSDVELIVAAAGPVK